MKRTYFVLAVVAFSYAHISPLMAAGDSPRAGVDTENPEAYPWSNTSAFVRLPKSLLRELDFQSIRLRDPDEMAYALTDEFIQLCAITPAENGRVMAAVTHALHVYFTAKAKRWTPSKEQADLGGREASTLERFDFTQAPIPEERDAICEALQRQVRSILGPERAALFWEHGTVLQADNIGFGKGPQPSPGVQSKTIHAFVLRQAERGLEVVWHTARTTVMFGSRGQSGAELPYPRALDPYAPESIRPVLARWRQQIADSKSRPNPSSASVRVQPVDAGAPSADAPSPHASSATAATTPIAKWEEGVLFVEVPKTLLKSLRIAGLSDEHVVSEHATTAFGLTPAERQEVDRFYQRMQIRFEELERAHFKRPDPTETQFAIEAFPEEAKALREEWARGLERIVGAERGPLLAQACLAPVGFRPPRSGLPWDLVGRESPGPDWLHRGTAVTRLKVQRVPGRSAIRYVSWQSEGGERGISNGDSIPARWRHLLTPSMLRR